MRKSKAGKQPDKQSEQLLKAKSAQLARLQHELKIEASLEKVRKVAMSMKKPEDMLTICKTIATQLAKLGVKEIRNVQTAIFYESRGTYMNYEYYAKHDRTFITETTYNNNRMHKAFAQKMLKGRGQNFVTHIKGKKVKEWLAYQKTTNVFIDKYLNSASSLSYYWHSLGPVALGISTYVPLKKEETALFHRFLKVFELSFRRHLDIEKANAQAREAQIEASLERIRAASMAMKDSSALSEIIFKLYGELTKLDTKLDRCFIMIVNQENKGITWWMSGQEGLLAENGFFIPMNQHPSHLMYLDNCKKRKKKWTYLFEGKEKRDWDKFGFSKTELARLPEIVKKDMAAVKKIHLSGSSDQFGSLVTGSLEPLPEEQQEIISRFAVLFNQAYTRFLDLQNAETQAREAQIEVALERVRATAMAMHTSKELKNVAKELRKQIAFLGQSELNTCVIHLYDESAEYIQSWGSQQFEDNEEIAEFYGKVPRKGLVIIEEALKAYSSDRKDYTLLNEKNKLKQWMLFLKQTYPDIYEMIEESYHEAKPDEVPAYWSFSDFNGGSLLMVTLEPPAKVSKILLRRFANVFELAYRRFVDLKNAEIQAREAKIEAALEKVRSASLAMHRSDELKKVIVSLFDRLTELGLIFHGSGIYLFDKEKRNMQLWIASKVADPARVDLPYDPAIKDNPISKDLWNLTEKGQDVMNIKYCGKEKNEYYRYVGKYNSAVVPEAVIDMMMKAKCWTASFAVEKHSAILIDSWDGRLTSNDDFLIVKRFARVFEQAYVRFLDLQKAEAQARESQIQLALERVRARTMAMQSSEELADVSYLLNKQVVELGIPTRGCAFNIYNEHDSTEWFSNLDGTLPTYKTPRENIFLKYYEAGQRGETLWIEEFGGDKIKEHYKYLYSINIMALGDEHAKKINDSVPDYQIDHVAYFKYGYLLFITLVPAPEAHEVFKRFAKEFEQTYTRFLDLQKAEAQAREAQIEAALERIRSISMAIRKSSELLDIIHAVFGEWKKLGLEFYECNINLFDRDNKVWTNWGTGIGDAALPSSFLFPWFDDPFVNQLYEDTCNNIPWRTYNMSGELKHRFLDNMFAKTDFKNSPAEYREALYNIPKLYLTHAFMQYGSMDVVGPESPPESIIEILKRFAKVFEQAYTRYLDVVQAETQAREAQIEAALERVRSRTMAMHKSDELPETSHLLFEQMKELGEPVEQLTIGIVNEENNVVEISATLLGDTLKKIYNHSIDEPYMMAKVYKAWKKQQKTLVVELKGDELNAYNQYRNELTNSKMFPTNLGNEHQRIVYAAFFSKGMLAIGANESRPPESLQLLVKFASVFDLTYTRFLDLQKAEAQAKEAQTEAALERVRGKAMAMHNSNDVIATAGVLFTEMRKMGINTFRSGVGLFTKENRKVKLYSAATTGETDNLPVVGSAILDGHEVLSEMYDRWMRNEDYFPVLKGELLKTYYRRINSNFTVPVEQTEHYEQHGYFLSFSEGMFYGWSEKPYTDDEIRFLQRLKVIVALTFRRYMELQRAEANALDALRSASLDRVRAEIASMRTPADLEKITPLIWKELTVLNIPFIRCGVFIMDEEAQLIHTFLSTPDGKAIAAFHLPYESTPLSDSIAYWRAKEMYQIHWDRHTFSDLADSILAQGIEMNKAQYLSSVPAEGIQLHLLPFLQGMFYVGNTAPLDADSLSLIQSVANAFSTAYARYEDFIKLEEARNQTENALLDLQVAQKQLIQSEKMASLGELTAGIAHEIQNPLNFVNNFSEVSAELVKEMVQEVEKGNTEEVKEIAEDVVSNLEKINHHGKRAADIVKGMLQHSRSGSGAKEPTDINALCDEYLRLAYHGLRAKDKSFNAKFETHLDPSVGMINVMPQDMGRVILNLINNAFYAVSEKKKEAASGYEPTVKITTQRTDDSIIVSVKDNGIGIPQKVIDKIFQPFFTTKPTGQGTGLGLSLSYDIVKAHDGELKVETKEGKGSEFIIQLPS